MNRARLSTLAAGLLGYALDAGAWALHVVGRVLLRTPEQRCVACFNAFDPALIRGDGRCVGCHRDARGSVAPAPPSPVIPHAFIGGAGQMPLGEGNPHAGGYTNGSGPGGQRVEPRVTLAGRGCTLPLCAMRPLHEQGDPFCSEHDAERGRPR